MFKGYSFKNEEISSITDEAEAFNRKERFWLDYTDISKQEIGKLAELIGLHPVTIEDLQEEEETTRIKYENFENYTFIVYTGLKKVKKDEVEYQIIYLIIGKNFIITIHKENNEIIENLRNNKNRLQIVMSKGVDYILYNIMDKEIELFYPVVEKLEKEVDRAERKILIEKDESEINELFNKKAINKDIRSIIIPSGRVILKILKPSNDFIGKDADIYFRDAYDNIVKLSESLQSNKEQINEIISEHNATLSSKMNETMKVLTIIATIMLPLTLISGIYGMNLPILPGAQSVISFYIITGFMVVIAIIMLIFFKKKKWI